MKIFHVIITTLFLFVFLVDAKAEPTDYNNPLGRNFTLSGNISHNNLSGRPSDCPKTLWCGCWLSYKVFGKNHRDLWKTTSWLKFTRTTPSVGSIAVLKRRGGGHVGLVQGFDNNGNPILLSGNYNKGVGVGTFSKNKIIAYVKP